jgi:hypothetical protein
MPIMQKAPKLIYLLRKSRQDDAAAIPVLKRDDLPLRFYFKGHEVIITATKNGNIEVSKQRLTGTDGK